MSIQSSNLLLHFLELYFHLSCSRSRHKSGECSGSDQKHVLILGAGMVSSPVVEYLSRDEKISINICSQFKDEADRLANKYPRVRSTLLDINENPGHLAEFCSKSDVVISLLPYALHGEVAQHCIDTKTHLVTASYITNQVQALHESAQNAGITILNEVGLDPGIDHFLALEFIKEAQEKGGSIESFISYCGGLPAPEFSQNPLRYKFSWSPRGALANTLSAARYLNKGQVIDISSGGDLMSSRKDLSFLPGFALEGFPNRDSTKYGDLYGIGTTVQTLLRGTIRYKGFSDCVKAMQMIGLLDTEPHPMLHPNGPEITWVKLMVSNFECSTLDTNSNIFFPLKQRHLIVNMLGLTDPSMFYENLKKRLSERISISADCIEQLGLLDDVPVARMNTPIDTLSYYLSKRLAYGRLRLKP